MRRDIWPKDSQELKQQSQPTQMMGNQVFAYEFWRSR